MATIRPRLAGAILVQAIAFLGPLAVAAAGLLSGELAGLSAPILWFCVGVPLSYRFLDRPAHPQPTLSRRKVLRPVRLG